MKEYLLEKYKAHYITMKSYMRAFSRENDKKIEYEYGACAAIGNLLTDLNYLTQAELINYRDSLNAAGVRL